MYLPYPHRFASHHADRCRTVHVQLVIVYKEDACWGVPGVFNDVLKGFLIGLESSCFMGRKVIMKRRSELHLIQTAVPVDLIRIRETGEAVRLSQVP